MTTEGDPMPELTGYPDANLIRELRSRGYTVDAVRLRPHRRAVFEVERDNEWHPTGAWRVATNDRSADYLCLDWCEREQRPGVYRAAIYEGHELVEASATRTLT